MKTKQELIEENQKLKILLAQTMQEKTRFTNSAQIALDHASKFAGVEVEQFRILLLDNKHAEIKNFLVSQGILNESLVHPREVFIEAVRHRAAAIVLMHNHPSGDPEPSQADISTTHRLKKCGDLLGINVLDHIIFAGTNYYSFVDSDIMPID